MDPKELKKRVERVREYLSKPDWQDHSAGDYRFVCQAVVALADELAAEREKVRNLESTVASAPSAAVESDRDGIESLAQNQVDPPPEVTEFIEQNFFELIDAPANPGPGVDECLSMQGAPTQTEVDALRAEVERLREERDEAVNDVGEWCECVHEAGELLGVRPGDEVRPGVLAKIRELIEDRERITMDRNNLVVMYNTAHATADEAIKQRDEARRCSCEELRNTRLANTIIREERDEARAEVERAQNLLLAVIMRISPAEVDNQEFFGCSYTDSDIEDLGAYEYLASVGKLTRHKVAKDGWMRTVDPDAVMKEAWDCAAMREHIKTMEREVERLTRERDALMIMRNNMRQRVDCAIEDRDKAFGMRDEARAERDKACNELTTTIKQYDEDERSRQQQYAYQYDCQRAEIDNLREELNRMNTQTKDAANGAKSLSVEEIEP